MEMDSESEEDEEEEDDDDSGEISLDGVVSDRLIAEVLSMYRP